MKKGILLLVVMLIATTFLFAAAKAEEQKPDRIEILYWRGLTGVAGEAQEEIARRFNESRDDIHVTVEFQGAYAEILQKMQAALAAGDVPDL
ncbi:MAG TPA: hypothetical protein PLD69_09750, partial [Sphaerochaeta sp.]|nr:hypothetical protein [Sphaerochaeta sp.]